MEATVAYSYSEEKHKIFTEEGQVKFLQVRDKAKHLLKEAGALKMFPLLNCISGDTWEMMAYVDRLVELGEIREVTTSAAGQDRVFVSA
jgi:hypothetical protein